MKYNKNQIEEILNNNYILKCSENSLTFTKECKIESVKLWNQWYWTKEIFRKFNFPEYISDSKIPEISICRWNRQFQKHWENAFWIMSRRWNCIDNAPTESFFGHLKYEINVSWCNNFNELEFT